jgi:hypothetical protein
VREDFLEPGPKVRSSVYPQGRVQQPAIDETPPVIVRPIKEPKPSAEVPKQKVVEDAPPARTPAVARGKAKARDRSPATGTYTPGQVAQWLQSLPLDKDLTSKLSDAVLSRGIDGAAMTESKGLRSLEIAPPRECMKISKWWVNVLEETAFKNAAKVAGEASKQGTERFRAEQAGRKPKPIEV